MPRRTALYQHGLEQSAASMASPTGTRSSLLVAASLPSSARTQVISTELAWATGRGRSCASSCVNAGSASRPLDMQCWQHRRHLVSIPHDQYLVLSGPAGRSRNESRLPSSSRQSSRSRCGMSSTEYQYRRTRRSRIAYSPGTSDRPRRSHRRATETA
jgi:hypothetical protein